ncbi:MAG: flagellar biosynthesis protein FlhB [Desulfobulbaceae bacterium]|nr:flagellar biosynthesis protein FlhB [Desulfobulbaceae bacterium]
MAEDTPTGERSEAPSAKRRKDFREKGQVSQSKEVQTAILFTFMLVVWYFYASMFWRSLSELSSFIWSRSGVFSLTPDNLMSISIFIIGKGALIMTPFFLTVLIAGFLSTFIQVGWLITGKPMIPKLEKLDPIKGAGRMISKRSFMEIIKSVIKVLLIGWLAYTTIAKDFPKALLLSDLPVIQTLLLPAQIAGLLLMKICGLMIFIGLLDYGFVRYEMEEKMKMTKQEQKEEMKESEGDPYLKSKIRSIQQSMARKRMMAEVPEADVIITNPTHIAVALQYKRGEMNAPMVIAKGKGLIAEKIKEIGKEHNIPTIENPPVARLLHSSTEVGQMIPEELFKTVAEILAHIYSIKGMRR